MARRAHEIQPAGGYREAPVAALRELFSCTWEARIAPAGAPAKRVIPDNCADFIVSSAGSAWLVGPATRTEVPALAPGTVLRGLRIRTPAIRAVSGTDAADLTDTTAALDDLLASRAARLLTEALWEQALTPALLTALWPRPHVDPAVSAAVRAFAHDPRATVADVASGVAFSPRHLRRLVQQETGLAPKTIQRVSRAHRVLTLARGRGEALGGLGALAFAAGYADQSHLARDVRAIAGLTPAQFVAQHA